MEDLFRFILEYQCLERKRSAQSGQLAPAEGARHEALRRLVTSPPEPDSSVPRRYARVGLSLEATYLRGDRVVPVVLRDLGGGGVALSCSERLTPGEVGVLEVTSPDDSFRGRVLGQIVWFQRNRAGMVFTGTPHLR